MQVFLNTRLIIVNCGGSRFGLRWHDTAFLGVRHAGVVTTGGCL
ncbi:MAG: hypothetical protein AB1611_11450 [bacterium]